MTLNTALIYNRDNESWKSNDTALFLGEPLGLFDAINVKHPKIADFYIKQKSVDWTEDEVGLIQDIQDMKSAPKAIVDIMVKNLSYQWEIDSIAAKSFATLLAPFITDSQFSRTQFKFAEIEGTHAATYAEIVRQCIPDTNLVLSSIQENKKIKDRSTAITVALEDLALAGAQYTLGLIPNDQALYNRVFKAYVAMYLTERIQFMSSFPSTFITAENGYFQGSCRLIQKIAIDEFNYHAPMGRYVINYLLNNDKRAQTAFDMCQKEIKQMIKDVVSSEHAWAKYIFTEGRRCVGLNTELCIDFVDWNAWEPYNLFGFTSTPQSTNPLTFMNRWFDINLGQTAQQEIDNTNYQKIFIKSNLNDTEILDF